jgi:hypothetical protein
MTRHWKGSTRRWASSSGAGFVAAARRRCREGRALSAKIGRLRFEAAAADLLTDYQVNGKRSHKNLKNTIIDGALEPWFRGRP